MTRERQDGTKRSEILAAATQRFGRDGYEHTKWADVAADVVYARLQTGSDEIETAYAPEALDLWADRLRSYAAGGRPADLPAVDPAAPAPAEEPREVYAFFIHEGKVRAPAAAMALLDRLGAAPAAAG